MRYHSIILLLLVILAPTAASSQQQPTRAAQGPGVVQGTVVAEETGEPLASVSVVVRSASDSAVVAGDLSGPQGSFRVAGLQPGRYLVEVLLLGRQPYRQSGVTLTAAQPVADLETIRLSTSAIALEGIVAEGERVDVQMAPDRTIYSTRDMPVASGGMATDVLQSVPELQVDIEGNVEMRGAATQVYLNGRPAPMEGESLQLFLQQFPADRIDRIEVIPNPSARFQAEGAGGIVNIVLKENANLGLSGNVFLNGGTRGDLGGGGRITYQRGPLTLFGGGFLRFSSRGDDSYDFRQNLLAQPITFLQQEGGSERVGQFGNVDLTAEYDAGERSTVWGEVRLFRRGNDSDALIAYTHLNADSVPTQRYDRDTNEESMDLSTDLVAGYQYVLEPQRHQLETELRYERGGDDQSSRIRRLFFTPTGADAGLPVEITLDDTDEEQTQLSYELDYIRPWTDDGQLEIGYRGDFERTENDRLLAIFAAEDAEVPTSATERGFDHQETFHSAYLTVLRNFGKLGVQVGARAERADTRLTLPDGQNFDNNYGSIFPSGNIRYEVSDGKELRLSYSKRIRRPSERVLNPINRSDDPLNRTVGNPYIAPQYNHSVSLDASWTGQMGTLRFSPFYRKTVDDWAEIKTVDQEGISTVTWENLASVENYGTSLSAHLRAVGGVSGFVSVSGYREERDASNLAASYSGSSLQWDGRANLQARLISGLSLQGMVYYRPAREVPQGRYSSMTFMNFGLRQQLWNDRASINLMVRDPLDIARFEFTTRDQTHIQTGRSDFSMRSAVLSFSYSFGRPPRDTRDSEQGQTEDVEPAAGIR